MTSHNRILHPVRTDRQFYVFRVGRRLEVRAHDTHKVLQVIEPPADWGDQWLWSCVGFDGVRCVPLAAVSLVRLSSQPVVANEAIAPEQPHESRPAGMSVEGTIQGEPRPLLRPFVARGASSDPTGPDQRRPPPDRRTSRHCELVLAV